MSSIPLKANDKEFFAEGSADAEVARLHKCACSAVNKGNPEATKGLSQPSNGDFRQIQISNKNPFVLGPDGRLYIDLCMNLSFFQLEEIDITVQGNMMTVKATREENEKGTQVKNELVRELQLPSGSKVSDVEAQLTKDGILLVKGPLR